VGGFVGGFAEIAGASEETTEVIVAAGLAKLALYVDYLLVRLLVRFEKRLTRRESNHFLDYNSLTIIVVPRT